MYHLELRQGARRVRRFNLDGPKIGSVLMLWAHERTIELGEHKFSPAEATIAVMEGPEVPAAETSMDRGWRVVERDCTDVTEQVVAEARSHLAAEGGAAASSPGTPAAGAAGAAGESSMALALQIGALLGPDATRLLELWSRGRAQEPGSSPSESLARAEEELRAGGS